MTAIEPIDRSTIEDKHTKYNKSQNGRNRRRNYRHNNSKWMTDTQYLSRNIVGVDGEGVTREDGSHDYIMLAVSGGVPSLRNPGDTALTRAQILRYLWTVLSPNDLNVIYGGSYDFNMWLKGTDRNKVRAIYKGNFLSTGVMVDGFNVKWVRGKSFTIARGNKKVIIYDTIAFFQCKFVDACDAVLKEYEGRDFLVRQKAARGTFDVGDSDEISRYNNLEVDLLVRLIATLREHLNSANIRPTKWYGPGAIASSLLRREGIKQCIGKSPDAVRSAARFAYAGGRFEPFKYGDYDGPVWEYDINSAYPAAIQHLPNLTEGDWIHHDADVGSLPFALYRIEYRAQSDPLKHEFEWQLPGAMFYRTKSGSIAYPPYVINWVWSPEADAIRAYCEKYGASYRVLEVWEFKRWPGSKLPFTFVGDLYAKRQNAKRAGQGVQLAYKLALLNSLYGKLAQQVGWIPATSKNPARLPPYHCIEWAGYVTSYCRALILKAITLDRDAVVCVETDALFVTHPLDLPLNDGLGAWKEERFSSFTMVQSGHWYGTSDKDGEVIKCRGIDKGWIGRAMVQKAMHDGSEHPTLTAPLTRFYGAGIALARSFEAVWCRWGVETKELKIEPQGKRLHALCRTCMDGEPFGHGWHGTAVPVAGGASHEYPIAWENPNPDMTELEELRMSEVDWENGA